MTAATRLLTRPEAWALVTGFAIVAIYMASMAASGPWDPWETHYGEVARQIIVRHDPLDLWWQPGNEGPDAGIEKSFASKPALPFWLMALCMKAFGVGTSADPAEMVRPFWPEFSIRLPSMLAGLASACMLGYVAWRLVSPRAGVLTGVVLCTMPQWAIVTRQALTDMFFVGPVVLACCAWAMAWLQTDRSLRTRTVRRWTIPWDRAYLAFVIVLVLAALVPLAVLHQHAFDPFTWRYHVGRSAHRAQAMRDIQVQLFAYWVLATMVVVRSLFWRRRSQAWMGIVYLAGGLSLMGKGLIGPGLIGAVVLAHLAVGGRWALLRKAGLPTGIVLFAVSSFPWHHAMMLYRGERWVNELIIQNNLQRFASGEQKQAVGGFAYYLETLGLAALPWIALVPLAIWGGFRAFAGRSNASSSQDDSRGPTSGSALVRFAMLWFAVSLLAISFSVTKYYHYLLPVLPPLALLVAVWIDREIEHGRSRSVGTFAGVLVGIAILMAVVRDVMHTPAWIAHLTTYLYTGFWTKGAPEVERLMVTVAPFGIALVFWLLPRRRIRRHAALGFVLSGLLTTAYVIDDYIPAASESWSQRSALRIYFDERGPDDRLLSWWFYYRGETFFTKADVWVMRDPDRQALVDYIAERRGMDAHLWFITIDSHASRLSANLPYEYRDGIEEIYRNFHYVLLRVHVP